MSAACPFRVSGFTFSGVPGVVIGHNDKVAWGMTNLGPDVTDFYLEQVSGDTYLRDGAAGPLVKRQEIIKVAGGADVPLTVRSTVHGPILSDVVPAIDEAGDRSVVRGAPQTNRYAVSLAWTALTPGTRLTRSSRSTRRDGLGRLPRGGRRVLRAVAEPRLRRHGRPHRLPGARPIPVRRSATPGAPPGYWPAPGWD